MALSLLHSAISPQPGSSLGSNGHIRILLDVQPLGEDNVSRLHPPVQARKAIYRHILLDIPWEVLWALLLAVEAPNPRKISSVDEVGGTYRFLVCRLPRQSGEGL